MQSFKQHRIEFYINKDYSHSEMIQYQLNIFFKETCDKWLSKFLKQHPDLRFTKTIQGTKLNLSDANTSEPQQPPELPIIGIDFSAWFFESKVPQGGTKTQASGERGAIEEKKLAEAGKAIPTRSVGQPVSGFSKATQQPTMTTFQSPQPQPYLPRPLHPQALNPLNSGIPVHIATQQVAQQQPSSARQTQDQQSNLKIKAEFSHQDIIDVSNLFRHVDASEPDIEIREEDYDTFINASQQVGGSTVEDIQASYQKFIARFKKPGHDQHVLQ
ncbi:hypothetical protein FGO68_gene15934 [Halteria grandinella]|uniref:Uncharacterized protein n=1 Tax=Halteria grandinella TaxID=5974 RepID=A0A8J8NLM8_HALGN|nr:hypothetical protein FGO68_gene15934 [Halteria grandinella]